jgi:hypothetical protein
LATQRATKEDTTAVTATARVEDAKHTRFRQNLPKLSPLNTGQFAHGIQQNTQVKRNRVQIPHSSGRRAARKIARGCDFLRLPVSPSLTYTNIAETVSTPLAPPLHLHPRSRAGEHNYDQRDNYINISPAKERQITSATQDPRPTQSQRELKSTLELSELINLARENELIQFSEAISEQCAPGTSTCLEGARQRTSNPLQTKSQQPECEITLTASPGSTSQYSDFATAEL